MNLTMSCVAYTVRDSKHSLLNAEVRVHNTGGFKVGPRGPYAPPPEDAKSRPFSPCKT